MIQSIFITLLSVFEGSLCSFGPPSATVGSVCGCGAGTFHNSLVPSHSPLVSSLLPDLQSSPPQSSTPPPRKHSPHYCAIHFYASILPLQSNSLYPPKSAPTTCCDARDTILRPPPPINTTPGSALTPTVLPIVPPESRVSLQSTKDPWTFSSIILALAPV